MPKTQILFISVFTLCTVFFLATTPAHSESFSAAMHLATAEGDGKAVGTVTFTDNAQGILITTNLQGLPPGEHGFHVHANASCAPTAQDGKVIPAGAAGGHYDPTNSGKHLGPGASGHKGDLPLLMVGQDGTAKVNLSLKGVKAAEFKNHALMIHAGGDNYSDSPAPLGGGGSRLACGVIK
ncbi:MAG: superoxide dismutase family protein [Desulfovibrio sp.]|jgi:Cu-Zn family superoxide dismutase|nr:superoxide dismutase family protein [Desulfovibrio sp.]